MDASEAVAQCPMLPSEQDVLITQAPWHTGTLHGPTIATDHPGYNGQGFVTGLTDASHSVDLLLPLPQPQCIVGLWLRYRAPWGEKLNTIQVNKGEPLSLHMPQTQQWAVVYAGRWAVQGAECVVRFQSDWGWVQLDSLYAYRCCVVPPPAPRLWHPPRPLQPAAAQLMRLLVCLRAHGKTLTGQQGLQEVHHVHAVTGHTPAVLGLDLLNYTSAVNWRDGTPEQAIQWHTSGGIVTCCWHWFSPTGKQGDKHFYTNQTSFDPGPALQPTHPHHALLLHDIDMIARELTCLQAAGVPVLWRPLHEAEGAWFWWGRAGPTVFVQLWRLLHARLVGHHGLGNLIWVYTSGGDCCKSHAWYPGDHVVDVVATDAYGKQPGMHSSYARRYHECTLLPCGTPKLVALGEVDSVPCLDTCTADMAPWAWFCVWNGHFATDGQHNAPEVLRKVYSHPNAVCLEQLPLWRARAQQGDW